MILHAYTSYLPADPESARRHRIAQSTWTRQPWIEVPVQDAALPRLFRERGREFPYVKDLFDFASNLAGGLDDIVIYTNADIQVRGDCCVQIAARLQEVDACYCYRRDFHHRIDAPVPDVDYVKGLDYPGTDLFAFRVGWWFAEREEMPDMLIGNEAYDPVLRQLIEDTNFGAARVAFRDLICHERHGSYWENPVHRYTLRSQLHNLGLARAFFRERGINPAKFGIP